MEKLSDNQLIEKYAHLISKYEPSTNTEKAYKVAREKFSRLGRDFVLERIEDIPLEHDQKIKQATYDIKSHIIDHADQKEEQLIFSFLPTPMTRVSPFFPMNRREMKDRPFEKLIWVTNWGQVTISGERLSIHDEDVLLAILHLIRKYRESSIYTTKYELCKVMGITPAFDTYKALWGSIERLTKTGIDLLVWEGKGRHRKTKMQMTATILSGGSTTVDKLVITVNPYFLDMFAEGFIANINMRVRSGLKGDITKSLYRFLRGQRGKTYECHILTMAKAININLSLSMREIRKRLRKALRELEIKGYLKEHNNLKNDIIKIEKMRVTESKSTLKLT